MVRYCLIVLFATTFITPSLAQEKVSAFDVAVQIRPRSELRNGQGTLISETQNPAFFVSNRARIKTLYTSEKISIGLAGQSVGVWGQQPQIEQMGGFMLNEAWVKLSLNQNWNVTIGRQAMAYDGDRILGTLDWHTSGRFHDLALLKYETKKFNAHLGAAYNANAETKTNAFYYPTGQPYQHLEIGWLSYQLSNPLKVTVLLLNTGFQGSVDTLRNTWKTQNIQTGGFNLFYQKDKLKMQGVFYGQMGESTMGTNVEAFMTSLTGSYQAAKSVNISIGADYLSGNDMNSTSTTQKAFDPLYGTHHKFYGYMDYFYVGNHLKNVGLIDLYAGLGYQVGSKLIIKCDGHVFNAAAAVVDKNSIAQNSYLGTEVDLSFNYKIMPGVSLAGGYSQMFYSNTMELVKSTTNPSDNQSWTWLMLNADLTVFSSKK